MADDPSFYDRTLRAMSRRQLLNAAWKLGAAAVVAPTLPARVLAQPVFAKYPFTLGVASGDPWPDGVVLWTRLAPDPLEGGGMPMVCVEVGWEVASDSAFRTIERKGVATARPELGHSVHVEVDGLRPGRDYWYRFHAGTEVSPAGRTKTAPAANRAVDQLRFGVCGCSHFETGYFTAYRRVAEERFDFVFHTGDYIYEDRADGGRNPVVVRQHRSQELFTLVDYRNRYAQYKSDPDLEGRARLGPLHHDRRRSRGGQRLRWRRRRTRHPSGGLPASPRRRLSGVPTKRCRCALPPFRRDRTSGRIGACNSAR